MMNPNRREILAGAAALMLPRMAVAEAKRLVVVELFTSQGCASCPPADQLFSALSQRSDLITLTYHVDYWDYLGWRDTLAKEDFSQRQYDYANARGDKDVYTPQAVIQGDVHCVGSKPTEIEKAIGKCASDTSTLWVSPTAIVKGKELQVELPALAGVSEATVWIASVTAKKQVQIERGENAGNNFTYTNVVRALVPAGMWQGEAKTLTLPSESVVPQDCRHCVVLVQRGKVGPIIGATLLSVTT